MGDLMSVDDIIELILSDNPEGKILDNEDIIFNMIPELKKCKGFNQNNEWHIYDVYTHILKVVSKVPNTPVLRLAALFHDTGKPSVYYEDDNGVGHFKGHWIKSQIIFEDFADKYQLNEQLRNDVSLLILYHDKNLENLEDDENLDIINKFDINGIENLFSLKEADLLSQSEKYHHLLNEYAIQKRKILLLNQKLLI